MNASTASIFRRESEPGEIAIRLVCFPCAGGDVPMYRRWPKISPGIEKVCVQLAGRGARRREPPARRMATLVAELMDGIWPIADRPLVFFGHSMGGWVAYELARAMHAADIDPPRHLILSASLPIVLGRLPPFVHTMGLEQLQAELRVLGGTPSSVLESRAALSLYREAIQADFEVFETHRHVHRSPLPSNASLWAAVDDPRIPLQVMSLWKDLFSGSVHEHHFSGGHMYLASAENDKKCDRYLADVLRSVGTVLDSAA